MCYNAYSKKYTTVMVLVVHANRVHQKESPSSNRIVIVALLQKINSSDSSFKFTLCLEHPAVSPAVKHFNGPNRSNWRSKAGSKKSAT